MPNSTKMKYVIGFFLFYLSAYMCLQAGIVSHKFDFLTEYDLAIPFMPQYIWLYHTMLPAICLTLMLAVKSREVFLSIFWSCVLAAIILNISYLCFPSFYPRQDFEVSTLSEALVYLTRQIDGANNTFPSGHVAFSWLLVFGIWSTTLARKFSYIKFIYILWAIGISLSTIVLKQHYIVDVFSGVLLALICFYMAKPLTCIHMRLVKAEA